MLASPKEFCETAKRYGIQHAWKLERLLCHEFNTLKEFLYKSSFLYTTQPVATMLSKGMHEIAQ